MTTPDESLTVDFGPRQASGRTRVYLRLGDEVLHSDNISLSSSRSRKTFLNVCKRKAPGLSDDELDVIDAAFVQQSVQADEVVDRARDALADAAEELRSRDEEADAEYDALPGIQVNRRQLRHVANDAWRAVLGRGTDAMPVVFVRDGFAVGVVDKSGRPVIHVITDNEMAARLTRAADWTMMQGGGPVDVMPPMRVAKDMIAMPYEKLKPLEAILSTPVFSSTEALLLRPGYYPDDAVILHEPLQVPDVPDRPTHEDVAKARSILDELVVNFPFATPSDRAHAIGMAVTPVVRRLFSGASPLHCAEAPTPGSGKNLLVEVLSLPSAGILDTHPFPTSDTELKKAVTAILLEGPTVVLLDNSKQGHEVNSPVLAALLTAAVWRDRYLGVSRMVDAPNLALWVMTGNNPRFSMELARRTVRIRLTPTVDRPWTRTEFLHPQLKAWATERRADLLHALLVLVRHWVALGRPKPPERLGSFESWSDVVGGIVTAAGYPGFLGNREQLYDIADSETSRWRDFTAVWWREFGDTPQSVSTLVQLCHQHDLMADVLEDGSDRSQATRLGIELTTQRDRAYGGLRIELRQDDSHKGRTYRLVQVDASPRGSQGNVQGTLGDEGPPPQAPANTGGYDVRGTLGDLPGGPEADCTENSDQPGSTGSDPFSVSRPSWNRSEGPQGPPAVRSGDSTQGYEGGPTPADVPQTSPPEPAHDATASRSADAVQRRSGRLLLDDFEHGDICCVASRWKPTP